MERKYLYLAGAVVIFIIAIALWNPLHWKFNNNNSKPVPKTQQQDFSKLNKDDLLHKLFPDLYFKDGKADLSKNTAFSSANLSLKQTVEDYFVNNKEKSILLVAQLEGIPHAGGLYHSYLGLFDADGKLLTPASIFSETNDYNFENDKAQFGADQGDFGFYDCKGVKYILFSSSECPNGSCCYGQAQLYRINNGEFENIQTINNQTLTKANNYFNFIQTAEASGGGIGLKYGLKLSLSADKILIKKVPLNSNNGCNETDYKELKWNLNSCTFE